MTDRLVSLADIYGVDDAQDLSWMDGAVCVEVDPEVHFPGKGVPSEPAKELCRSCESRLPCLAYALRRPEWGVWGGFSEYGRAAVARQHQAGRSLADIIAADDAAYYERTEAREDPASPNERRNAAERRRRRVKRETAQRDAKTHTPQPREQAA